MCVRSPRRQASRVHGVCPRNQSQPRKSASTRQNAGTNQQQRRTKAHRKTRSLAPFHQQARGKNHTFLSATNERRKIRVDRRSENNIRRPQEDTLDPANPSSTKGTRTTVLVH